MKRMTLLAAIGVSVMMMGASVNAYADHNDRNNDRNHRNKDHHRESAKTHKHKNGATCSIDHGGSNHYQSEPSVCLMATEQRSELRRLRHRKQRLEQRYEYELDAYGWRVARETYYKLQRVRNRMSSMRWQVRSLENQCEIAKQRQARHYRYSYSDRWSNGYYKYDYSYYRKYH